MDYYESTLIYTTNHPESRNAHTLNANVFIAKYNISQSAVPRLCQLVSQLHIKHFQGMMHTGKSLEQVQF